MKEIKCFDSEELSAYLDSDLEPARRQEIESHLESCQDCVAVCDEFESLKTGLLALRGSQPVRDLWPVIEQAQRK
jgi:anti-sigma factor RsiW